MPVNHIEIQFQELNKSNILSIALEFQDNDNVKMHKYKN